MKAHPAADLFPSMAESEYAGLLADIRANGLVEDIVRDREGRVVDGRHRLRACEEAGIEPRFTTVGPDVDVLAYVVAKNLHRRHLSTVQRAVLAAKAIPKYREQAKKRQQDSGGGTGRAGGDSRSKERFPSREGNRSDQGKRRKEGQATAQAAEAFEVSTASVERAKTVMDHAPELIDQVEAGRMGLRKAAEVAIGTRAPARARHLSPVPDVPMPAGMKRSATKSVADTCRRAAEQVRGAIEVAERLDWSSLSTQARTTLHRDLYDARSSLTKIINELKGNRHA